MSVQSKKDHTASLKNITKDLLTAYRENLSNQVEPVKDDTFDDTIYESSLLQLRVEEKYEILKMRQSWSNIFKVILIVILVFEVSITILVGVGCLHYDDEWFLKIIVMGGFTNILVMPVLITKFLFPTPNGKSTDINVDE